MCIEARPARASGAQRRENVGMSNHNPNEKLEPRKSKVSVALAINHGLGGPKPIPKGAGDGQTVNIPSLLCDYRWRAKEIKRSALLVWHPWREVQASIVGTQRIYFANSGEEPSEKSAAFTLIRIRTGNRHRWIGREDQGERVICL